MFKRTLFIHFLTNSVTFIIYITNVRSTAYCVLYVILGGFFPYKMCLNGCPENFKIVDFKLQVAEHTLKKQKCSI